MNVTTSGPFIGILVLAMFFGDLGSLPAQAQEKPHLYWVYVGTNTGTGISLFKLDTSAGLLTSQGTAASANAPGFLAIAPNQKLLYAGIRMPTTDNSRVAGVEGFSIDARTGKLTPINQESSGGEEATFVTVDPSGKNVLVAHYSVATVSVLPVASDGKLSPKSDLVKQTGSSIDPQRQTHAYAHSINIDPAGKFAIACDLGADKLFVYRFDPVAGKLSPNDPPFVWVAPGSGPRHLTFHPNGKFVYVINEMGGTIIAYSYDADHGTFRELQTSKTLPADFKGTNTSAEVQIDPSGRFLYGSNRIDSNFLTIYTIDQATGKLTMVGYQPTMGRIPRNFRIDPTGKFLIVANQETGNIVLFKIDQNSGKLTPVGTPFEVKSPVCMKFVAVE